MKTLLFFELAEQSIPKTTAWYLADLGEYLGKQRLYRKICGKPARLNVSGEALVQYGKKRVIPLKEGNNEGND